MKWRRRTKLRTSLHHPRMQPKPGGEVESVFSQRSTVAQRVSESFAGGNDGLSLRARFEEVG
jgi:hypothetical protein